MGHLNHNNEPTLFRSYWAHPRIRIYGHPQRLRKASMVRDEGLEPSMLSHMGLNHASIPIRVIPHININIILCSFFSTLNAQTLYVQQKKNRFSFLYAFKLVCVAAPCQPHQGRFATKISAYVYTLHQPTLKPNIGGKTNCVGVVHRKL